MTPWQEGFVKQCEARGINPSAVAKYAEDYSKGQKAAQRLLEKRAAAAKAAFDSMTPYQQGFAIRCHQRGLLAEKVAAYALRKKAQEGPDGIGPTLGNEAALLASRANAAAAARAALESYDANAIGEGEGYDQSLLDAALADVTAEQDARDLAEAKREEIMAPAEEQVSAVLGGGLPARKAPSLLDRIIDKYYQGKDTVARGKAEAKELLGQGKQLAKDTVARGKAEAKELYGKGKQLAKDTVARGKAEAKELYGKGKETAQKAYRQGRDYVKTPKGKAVVAGGGAALTAALLGAYLLSRKKKKKDKK